MVQVMHRLTMEEAISQLENNLCAAEELMVKDWYEILGVSEDADMTQVGEAYDRVMEKYEEQFKPVLEFDFSRPPEERTEIDRAIVLSKPRVDAIIEAVKEAYDHGVIRAHGSD